MEIGDADSVLLFMEQGEQAFLKTIFEYKFGIDISFYKFLKRMLLVSTY